jgi:hypothetical protein
VLRKIALAQEQVGACIDEERDAATIRHLANCADAGGLLLHRVQPLAANHLILEIDTDGAGVDQLFDIGCRTRGLGGIGALEIDGERQIVGGRDLAGRRDQRLQRDLLAVTIALGGGNRPTARCQRLGAGLGHRLGGAGIPDIAENNRIALPVQRAERFRLV